MPVLVMLALGLWRLDRGGMWRDEAATFQVSRRSVPQIWHLLHHVDAVHGLYYLFMHVVLAVDPSEVALRLPSVIGAAATAGLVAALGVRLCRPRVGLWAGLLYAVTPWPGTSPRKAGRTRWSRPGPRERRCFWSRPFAQEVGGDTV